mmetsp:Transcript_27143/g.79886  ORF Transcript_27143/g.79886 Transcript_27143/m.79886 type:complete len:294 (+) Transcript_27143:950-1831(+)
MVGAGDRRVRVRDDGPVALGAPGRGGGGCGTHRAPRPVLGPPGAHGAQSRLRARRVLGAREGASGSRAPLGLRHGARPGLCVGGGLPGLPPPGASGQGRAAPGRRRPGPRVPRARLAVRAPVRRVRLDERFHLRASPAAGPAPCAHVRRRGAPAACAPARAGCQLLAGPALARQRLRRVCPRGLGCKGARDGPRATGPVGAGHEAGASQGRRRPQGLPVGGGGRAGLHARHRWPSRCGPLRAPPLDSHLCARLGDRRLPLTGKPGGGRRRRGGGRGRRGGRRSDHGGHLAPRP